MKKYPNLYQTSQGWHYRFTVNGRTFRGSCEAPYVHKARRVLTDKWAEAKWQPELVHLRDILKRRVDSLPYDALLALQEHLKGSR